MSLKERKEEYKRKQMERKAFRKIVNQRTTAAKRRAYEKEALKVAEEKGKALARRKPLGELAVERIQGVARSRGGQYIKRVAHKTVTGRARPSSSGKRKRRKSYSRRSYPKRSSSVLKPLQVGDLI